MMNAAVIVVLAVLLIPDGHCQPQVSSFKSRTTNSGIRKRQLQVTALRGTCTPNDFREFLANLTQDCEAGFNAWLGTFSQNANSTRSTAFCQPECGNQVIAFYNRCNASQELVNSVRGFCARNAANRPCYELSSTVFSDLSGQVASNCNSQSSKACSTGCQNALNTFKNNSGCCINVVNITTLTSIGVFTNLQNNLWSSCRIDTPGFCDLETSTLNSAEGPASVKALFLLIFAVMVMLLL